MRRISMRRATALVMALGVDSACLSADAPPAKPTLVECNTAKPPPDASKRVAISTAALSMMRVSMPCVPAVRPASLVGGYTRVVVDFVGVPGTAVRNYHLAERNWIHRYFAGKSIARALTVKATLARPLVGTTMPLMTVAHDSNRKDGESFTTDVGGHHILTPYFRIDPDSTMNLEFTLTALSKYDASMTADVLDLVKRAVTLVTPASTLVTSLNGDRFAKASQFIDQSISSFLQESVVERANNDFAARNWAGGELATVSLYLPMLNDITPTGGVHDDALIGSWTVRTEPALLSIFSDTTIESSHEERDLAVLLASARESGTAQRTTTGRVTVPPLDRCAATTDLLLARACAAFRNLDPATVMNFKVDASISIAQALAGDTDIAAARDAVVKADGPKIDDPARALCGLVANRAQAIGFNRIDVAVITWAYFQQGFTTQSVRTAINGATVCPPLSLASGLGLMGNSF